MIYAPVVIPTLNRYKHLKRCIESLQKNTGAQYTDLYISLDYPPSERYVQGYEKVREYLENKIRGFNNVFVYKQEKNLGPYANLQFVIEEALKKADRFILTEDDNEFSPNFLEFINKGLVKFEKDNHVMNICGYCHPGYEWNTGNDNAFRMIMAGWGSAFWREKYRCMQTQINNNYFESVVCKPKNMLKLYRESRSQFCYCVNGMLAGKYPMLFQNNGEVALIDIPISIYYIMEGKYSVLPRVSKVRNWGNDGSGVNCGGTEENNPLEYVIDENDSFEYAITEIGGVDKRNLAISSKINAPAVWFRMATVCRYLLWYLLLRKVRGKA